MSTSIAAPGLNNDPTTLRWIADSLPDLSGRVAVVTGANSGLGLETTRVLASKGAHVVMACRSPHKAAAAAEAIRGLHGEASIELQELDLASLASIEAFVERLKASQPALDLLINNAGVMAIPFTETADGFEMQFGTNHLGHFALTGRLLPLLQRAPKSRIVTVSSNAQYMGRMRFHDLHGRKRYTRWEAYCQSKLANVMFAIELDRRLKASGSDTLSVSAHPGYAHTGLLTASTSLSKSRLEQLFLDWFEPLFSQDSLMGALPQLLAATDPGAKGGELYGPGGPGHFRGLPIQHAPALHARNRRSAAKLWDVSTELTRVSFELTGPTLTS